MTKQEREERKKKTERKERTRKNEKEQKKRKRQKARKGKKGKERKRKEKKGTEKKERRESKERKRERRQQKQERRRKKKEKKRKEKRRKKKEDRRNKAKQRGTSCHRSCASHFLPSRPMGPVLGEVELSGLRVRPTFRRRVFWNRTPRGEPARGNGQEINWQREPLFSEEVYHLENFFKKKGLTLPINFLAISSRGFATRCLFPEDTTTKRWPDAEPGKFDFA